jgi:RNA polymerase sigma-70 factor, ECF subfamily
MRKIANSAIEKAATGDMGAFEEIYREFSSTVYTIALGITRDRQDAEEVTQDVFVKVFRGLKDFRFGSSFGTWLYRITMNTAINMYHKRARHGRESIRYDDVKDALPPGADTAKEEMERQDASARITELLKHISPEYQPCIMLREIEGLDYREIANILSIPLNTVRSRLKRAREALTAYCRKEGLQHAL